MKTVNIKIWLTLMLAIASIESMIMFVFWQLPSIPHLVQGLIDVCILTLALVPLTYRLVFLPLTKVSRNLDESKQQLQATQDQQLALLISLAEVRDDETGRHLLRTRLFVKALAERLIEMGCYQDELDDDFVKVLYKVAPLHDIGKVGIPDNILNKPARLSEDERALMMNHPAIGASILNSAKESFDTSHSFIATAAEMADAHHEKWDGTGYPKGLKALDIPLSARIMSIADMYDALTTERSYKEAWPHEQAVQEVIRMKGVAFDPIIVEAFLLEESHFKQIADDFKEGSS